MIYFDFSEALIRLKSGKCMARAGWNGARMWVAYSPGSAHLTCDKFWSPAISKWAEGQPGRGAEVLPSLTFKNANDEIQMGWTPTCSDMFAEDWFIVAPEELAFV